MNRIRFVGLLVVLAAVTALAVSRVTLATGAPQENKKEAQKEDKKETQTVTGVSSCGGCSGVADACCVMLTDSSGDRWILRGENDDVKAAFKARHDSKKMTATYSGKPTVKKGEDKKEYKEVTVTAVKVAS
jgi:hypothetical protein